MREGEGCGLVVLALIFLIIGFVIGAIRYSYQVGGRVEMCREMGGEWIGEVNAEGTELWSRKPAEGAK